MDDYDRMRFCYGLFLFNDSKAIDIAALKTKGLPMSFLEPEEPRERLVDIHGWCLMINHYHLLLSERVEHGISRFLQKLNIGYAKYFNDRHERVGTLYQGRTKQVLIETDAHFLHILHYIHLNPLDFLKGAADWRDGEIKNSRQALAHLDSYRWSSFSDYCGKKNFPSVITTELFGDVFKDYRKSVSSFVQDLDFRTLNELTLE